MDFLDWMLDIQQRMERTLDVVLPPAAHTPTHLHSAMRYVALGGGKRLRPLLCHATGSIFEAPENVLNTAAAAVELIHIYSLVHDDLPCMDDDVLRRGKPTCHVAFGEATALLVGDALQSLAFKVLSSRMEQLDATQQLSMLHTLAVAAGTPGMAGGQALDIAAVGKSLTIAELELMHIQKTGALIRAAVLLGALAGNASSAEFDSLSRFANRSGLLFQVVDDILDVASDTGTLGKTAGKDADHNKPTYVGLLGLAQAKALARDLLSESHDALAPFGVRAARLHELADFIVERKS
jgi:farnesyl diphosphate synthase